MRYRSANTTDNNHKPIFKATRWVLLSVVIGLLSFLVLAPSMRLIYDDYCQIAEAHNKGAITAVLDTYQTWSGRYSAYTFINIMGLIGHRTASVVPIILIISYVIALFGLFKQLAIIFKIKLPSFIAIHLALFITFIWLNIMGLQSIFWLAGAASYGVPVFIWLGFSTFLITIIRHRWQGRYLMIAVVLSFVIMVIVAGFSELYIVMQGMTITLLLVMSVYFLPTTYRQTALWILLSSLIGLAIGGYLVVSAPGNAIRLDAATGLRGMALFDVLKVVFEATLFVTLGDTFRFAGLLTCYLGLLIGLIWWYRDNPQDIKIGFPAIALWKVFWVVNVIAVIWLGISLALPLVGVGLIAPRVVIYTHLIHMLWMGALAYITAVFLIQRGILRRLQKGRLYKFTAYVIFMLLIFYPIPTIIRHMGLISPFSAYAQSWDERDAYIKAQVANGETQIISAPLPYDMEDYLVLDKADAEPSNVNHCIEQYYALEKFVIVDD